MLRASFCRHCYIPVGSNGNPFPRIIAEPLKAAATARGYTGLKWFSAKELALAGLKVRPSAGDAASAAASQPISIKLASGKFDLWNIAQLELKLDANMDKDAGQKKREEEEEKKAQTDRAGGGPTRHSYARTGWPMPPLMQIAAAEVAAKRGFTSMYWVTANDARDIFGTQIRNGETPALNSVTVAQSAVELLAKTRFNRHPKNGKRQKEIADAQDSSAPNDGDGGDELFNAMQTENPERFNEHSCCYVITPRNATGISWSRVAVPVMRAYSIAHGLLPVDSVWTTKEQMESFAVELLPGAAVPLPCCIPVQRFGLQHNRTKNNAGGGGVGGESSSTPACRYRHVYPAMLTTNPQKLREMSFLSFQAREESRGEQRDKDIAKMNSPRMTFEELEHMI